MTEKFTDSEGDQLEIRKSNVSDSMIITIKELDLTESQVETSASVAYTQESLPEVGSDIALTVLQHIPGGFAVARQEVVNHWELARQNATPDELLWLAVSAVKQYRIAHRLEVQEREREAKRQERREKIAQAIHAEVGVRPWNDLPEDSRAIALKAADAVMALLDDEVQK